MSTDMGLAPRHRDTPGPLSIISEEKARQVKVEVKFEAEEGRERLKLKMSSLPLPT
jgi:hypothetical protein